LNLAVSVSLRTPKNKKKVKEKQTRLKATAWPSAEKTVAFKQRPQKGDATEKARGGRREQKKKQGFEVHILRNRPPRLRNALSFFSGNIE